MCIFSGESTVAVSGTRIFGRVEGTEQYLVYQMSLGTSADTAMVLPLPIAPGHGDAAVRFIDLSTYPKFFQALEMMFPQTLFLSLGEQELAMDASRTLAVHRVGDFEASYVPSIADFARLDKRFQLSPVVWDTLPAYRDYGFAVFKLFQPKRGLLERIGIKKVEPIGVHEVHPMAFAFRTRSPEIVFFPTVHVHDGAVHEQATFDHELYCQRTPPPSEWECSESKADRWAIDAAKGVLLPELVYRRSIHGLFDNRDVHAGIRDTTSE